MRRDVRGERLKRKAERQKDGGVRRMEAKARRYERGRGEREEKRERGGWEKEKDRREKVLFYRTARNERERQS